MAKLNILPKKWDYLDINDSACVFRINIDVLNEAFGVGRGMFAKAVYPDKKDTYILGSKPGERYIIWMPKLYGNSSDWKNVLSDDGTEIYEVAENGRNEDWINEDVSMEDIRRIVFVKPNVKSPYRFVGVFKNGKMDFCNHTYKRVGTKIKLIGNPVERVEML